VTIRRPKSPGQEAKRVLVTGAGGFVGANLVRRLVSEGHAVTALVSPNSLRWRLAGLGAVAEFAEVDLCDAEAIRTTVRDTQPAWVFHLAAHGAYSWQTDLDRIMATNFLATMHLVNACRASGCEAFIHAGSSSEYGFKAQAPSESEAVEPNSAYAVAKAAATSYCGFMARNDGFPAVTLRLYSVYGPMEDPRRLMPALISRGLRNELPPLAGPDVAHDFVEVGDTIDALMRATAATRPGSVYNVGTGRQTSLADVVSVARRVLKIESEPAWDSATGRSWDTHSWVADNRKIHDELGWEPSTDLEKGFREMARWLISTPDVWSMYGVNLDDVASHAARTQNQVASELGGPAR
jgi:dolichol-phosphate mannosyltransferase